MKVSLQPKDLYTVVCRPGLPKDRQDILELDKDIWEGTDYIPQALDSWLADPEGLLAVAEYAGKVVGIGKLTQFTPQDWYLEGLRVDPRFEGHGVASKLHHYLVDFWLRLGAGFLRLVTASFRLPVQHLCEQTGFLKLGEVTFFRADAIKEEAPFSPLSAGDASSALTFLQQSPTLALTWGLIDLGWEWTAPAEKFLEERRLVDRIWWWRERQGLLAIYEDDEDEEAYPYLGMVACTEKDIPELLSDYRRLVSGLGYAKACWRAPLDPDLMPVLETTGFRRNWEDSLFVYEKPYPQHP